MPAQAPGQRGHTDLRILRAAAELADAYGDRRFSIDDVATRAGVARATVFRRFGSKELLLREVNLVAMTDAIEQLQQLTARARSPSESVVELFVGIVTIARNNARVQRLARLEPDRMLAAATTGDPSPLDLGRRYVAAQASRWQLAGLDPDAFADILTHLALSYVLAPSDLINPQNPASLRRIARRLLVPIVQYRPPTR
jgi:AcrR family transcriptional regulator